MIKGDSYEMMINHLSHSITKLGSSDKWAQFEVIILDKEKDYSKNNKGEIGKKVKNDLIYSSDRNTKFLNLKEIKKNSKTFRQFLIKYKI